MPEDGPKDEEKLSASTLEYREEREREKNRCLSGATGLGGPSEERPFHLSMEKVLEHVM